MAEQIMWAVKDSIGNVRGLGDTASLAWSKLIPDDAPSVWWCNERDRLVRAGYRCIRVRITEVQDEP